MMTSNGYFPWSGTDKSLHFQTGIPGGVVCYQFYRGTLHLKWAFLWTVLTGLAVGMTKELYDRRHHGTPEYADAMNTALGFAAGAGGLKIIF
jgi:hypothetical protein